MTFFLIFAYEKVIAMTLLQLQFIELLKSGLWGIVPDSALFSNSVNWKQLYKISVEQTVTGIIADGIEKLSPSFYPPKDILTRFIMSKVHIRKMNLSMNREINKIFSMMQESGIRPILLKGQGIAQYYINPESRSCGDIDMYIGDDNYNECCRILLESENTDTEKMEENFLHMGIKFNGIEVEIHRQAGYLKNRKSDYYFQTWTKEALDENSSESLPIWNNEGTDILLPDHTFNAFFLIQHIAKHISTEGIGFRQICDWVMFLFHNHKNINQEILTQKLHEYKMREIWDEFSLLAISHLGLPTEYLPVKPLRKGSKRTQKLMNEIFLTGNFGHYDPSRKTLKRYGDEKKKKRNIHQQIIRLSRIISLFPKYTVHYGINWMTGGIKRLF